MASIEKKITECKLKMDIDYYSCTIEDGTQPVIHRRPIEDVVFYNCSFLTTLIPKLPGNSEAYAISMMEQHFVCSRLQSPSEHHLCPYQSHTEEALY